MEILTSDLHLREVVLRFTKHIFISEQTISTTISTCAKKCLLEMYLSAYTVTGN